MPSLPHRVLGALLQNLNGGIDKMSNDEMTSSRELELEGEVARLEGQIYTLESDNDDLRRDAESLSAELDDALEEIKRLTGLINDIQQTASRA